MDVKQARTALVGVVLFTLVIAGGCGSDTGRNGTTTPAPTSDTGTGATPTGVGIRGQAQVDSLEINLLGTPPSVRVQVVARGNLPDGCTKVTDISQKRDGNTFTVTLGTFRAPNVMCIQVITPFIQTVDLNVAGLKAGTYTVNVDGVSKQFTLSADNPSK
jgi:inhibitor of cysteine peptidase